VVWCSNDYLGMGQNPVVLDAMQAEIDGGRRRRRRHAQHLGHHASPRGAGAELADLHQQGSGPAVHLGLCLQRGDADDAAAILPGLIIFSDALNHASMIAGIRNGGCERHIFRHNDLEHLEELLAARRPMRPS
jgi:5-aminolevulinate synthase